MSEQVEIDVNQTTQEVTIEVTAGAGLGTVTSVAISGTDGIQVDSGSPIITSGTIVLGLSSTVLNQLALASTALQNITGLVTAGANISISGSGTSGSPYQISAAGVGTINADDVLVDNSSWEVLTGGNVQEALDSADAPILNARGTGVRYGGVASVDGGLGVGTTISITAGEGEILDITNPAAPVYNLVTWSAYNTQAPSVTPGLTWWYIDSAGTLQQTNTEPTEATYRTRIWICQTNYVGGAITALANNSTPLQQAVGALHDLSAAIGTIRVSGAQPTFSGANLKLKITAGKFYDFGVTRWTAPLAPNSPTSPLFDSGAGGIFRYITTSGVINTDYTDVQVASYQVAGVVTAIPGASTRVGIHYIIGFPSGNTRLSYGLNWYNSFTDAIEALGANDPYNTVPSSINRSNSFILGAILAQKGAANLSNATQATFVTSNRFGQFGGSAALAGAGYLEIDQNLADLSSPPDALINLGLAATATELNYTDGVTSPIQAQLDGKVTSGTNANLSGILLAGPPPFERQIQSPLDSSNHTSTFPDKSGYFPMVADSGGAINLADISEVIGLLADSNISSASMWNAKIGGSTGATDNAVLLADGTGGLTAKAANGVTQTNAQFLDFRANTGFSEYMGFQFFRDGVDAGGMQSAFGFMQLRASNAFTFATSGVERVGISSTGTVGIGSVTYNSPVPLGVQGTAHFYNSFISGTNYEALQAYFNSNVGEFGTVAGSGGGTIRDFRLTRGGIAHLTLSSALTTANIPLYMQSTVTAAGTTGNRTINTQSGSVNFAAGASSLTVTSSLATANSIILATVRTDDSNMSSVQVESSSGSFIIYANSPPAAETRVDFFIAA